MRGFTLIEISVSIAVISLLGLLILTIFSNSLRGGNKAQIILTIKQNGQTILENMDKTIRGSDNIVCPRITPPATTASGDTLVTVKNGIYSRYRFVAAASSVNGQIQQDNPVPTTVTEEVNLSLFIDRVCLSTDPLSDAVILTDTNTATGVSVTAAKDTSGFNLPYVYRDKPSGFRDSVTLRFALQEGVAVTSGTAGAVDPTPFETTVQLR